MALNVKFRKKLVKMKKMITATRSFGKRVYSLNKLEAAIVTHIIRACQKLREEKAVAKKNEFFCSKTSYFGKINYYAKQQENYFGSWL
jgi:hypothetical protein